MITFWADCADLIHIPAIMLPNCAWGWKTIVLMRHAWLVGQFARGVEYLFLMTFLFFVAKTQ